MSDFGMGITDNNSAAMESRASIYLAKVMGWMALGLFTTFVAALLCLSSQSFLIFLTSTPYMYYGVIIAELVVVFGMSAAVNKISASMATVLFMVYSALTGMTMSVFFLLFQVSSIFMVFVMASALFLTMAVYGFVTKRDLTKVGSLALFGLVGIIIAGLVNMFIRSQMIDYIISFVGVLLFIVLTAYDTKKIKGIYLASTGMGHNDDSEPVRKAAIYGALTLYLDFINLFIMLLRIFGKRRS